MQNPDDGYIQDLIHLGKTISPNAKISVFICSDLLSIHGNALLSSTFHFTWNSPAIFWNCIPYGTNKCCQISDNRTKGTYSIRKNKFNILKHKQLKYPLLPRLFCLKVQRTTPLQMGYNPGRKTSLSLFFSPADL